jgi:hypothetical protein
MRRAVLGLVAALALVAGASATTAYADSLVNLSCDDGTNLNLTLDTNTLQELQDSVQAMLLYPAGIGCTVTVGNPLLATILNLAGLARPAYAASAHDFAVGAARLAQGTNVCQPTGGTLDVNLSAHKDTGALDTTATGHITVLGKGDCSSSRAKFDVDCLHVNVPGANGALAEAIVSGTVEGTPTGLFAGAHELNLTIEDYPSPTTDQLFSDVGKSTCAGGATKQTVVAGNFVVKSGA